MLELQPKMLIRCARERRQPIRACVYTDSFDLLSKAKDLYVSVTRLGSDNNTNTSDTSSSTASLYSPLVDVQSKLELTSRPHTASSTPSSSRTPSATQSTHRLGINFRILLSQISKCSKQLTFEDNFIFEFHFLFLKKVKKESALFLRKHVDDEH